MPRDYTKPYKDVGAIERMFSPAQTSSHCDRHRIPEPCPICVDMRARDLFADELLTQREYNGTEEA